MRLRLASDDKGAVSVRDQIPLEHVVAAGAVGIPLMRGVTVATSSVAVPHAPPIDATSTFVEYGNDRAEPFTLVTDTTGAVLSIVTAFELAVPVFVAASPCVADSVEVASADNGVVSVNVQLPLEHVVVAGNVPTLLMSGVTIAESPVAVPHSPPIDVTLAFVKYGNDRAEPFTLVTDTTGAVLSIVTAFELAVPVFVAASPCVADSVEVASADNGVVSVNVQLPLEHVVVAGNVPTLLMSGVTIAESPVAVPHSPPIDVTLALVEYGNDRAEPFTLATDTTGAVLSIVRA